ncbi:hypothetical protein TWF481_011764 [Arthrobotrys musiformis]|uniref:UspA domain-containing protein n=1 Tax=Arthrobotrys musiformis TaxID=47236 RepID=A0AAV9VV29_9PEZI
MSSPPPPPPPPPPAEFPPRDPTNSTDSSDTGSFLSQKSVRPPNDARRPSAIAFAEPDEPRRPSIQFKRDAPNGKPNSVGSGPSSSSLGAENRSIRKRSLSSPPPPPTFIKRVGFDTFSNKDATDFALTLKSKHKDYKFGRGSRTFLCGTDQNDYSTIALEWLLEELVDDNDEIVCLRVIDKDSKMAATDSTTQEKLYRLEAEKLLQTIISKNDEDKALSIVLEFCVGKVHDTFQRMVCDITPRRDMYENRNLKILYIDQSLRADHVDSWHPRPVIRRLPRLASGICFQILPSTLAGTCDRRPAERKKGEEKAEASR